MGSQGGSWKTGSYRRSERHGTGLRAGTRKVRGREEVCGGTASRIGFQRGSKLEGRRARPWKWSDRDGIGKEERRNSLGLAGRGHISGTSGALFSVSN
jgi:hypothetical protein